MRLRRNGFTLIELIVTIVIIGILAAISAPMMQNMKVKAICAEAVTAMGTIRAAARQYYTEFGVYPGSGNAFWIADLADEFNRVGLNVDDLNGLYFDKNNYQFESGGWMGWEDQMWCVPWGQEMSGYTVYAPKHNEAKLITSTQAADWSSLIMYLINGKIKQYQIPKSGFVENDGTSN